MARPGDELESPVTGERIVFRETAAETGGALLAFDWFCRAGGGVPLAHVHPGQEERFLIRSGTARLRLGRRRLTLRAREAAVVPPGTPHRIWNGGDEELEARVEFRPALELERFFENFFGLSRDGKTSRRGIPPLLQLAVGTAEFGDEVRLPWLPWAVQKAVLSAVAPLGRLRGYQASYPEYER